MSTIDTSPEAGPPKRRLRQGLAAVGLWLIEPAASLPEATRSQARLLSGVLLVLILLVALGIASILTLTATDPLPGLTLPITVFGTALLATAYLLNRGGHYIGAAGLAVAVTALGVWAAVIATRDDFANNPFIILYVLLSVAFCSLLFSPRLTAFLAAGHVAGIALAPRFIPGFAPSLVVDSILFVSFITVVIVVGTSLRQRGQAQLEAQALALHDSEQRFRALFAASPDAVLLIDPHDPHVDWPIVDCNDAACDMNGFSRDELVGQSIDILNASPGAPPERQAYLARLRREQTLHLEAQHKRQDGSLVSVEVSTALITLAGRELILGIDRDISERRRAEDILRESDARHRVLFDDSPASLWEEDFSAVKRRLETLRQPGGEEAEAYLTHHPEIVAECAALAKVTDVNKATLRLFRAASKTDLLQGLDRVLDATALDSFRNELVHIAQGHTELECERASQTLTGEKLVISLRWSVVPGYEDTLAKVLVSVTDITERCRAEAELSVSNAKLTSWLGELEERTREMAMLNEMVSLFQTCRTPEEAYVVVGKMAPALFAGAGGALGIVHPSRDLVETMATWGEPNYAVSVFQFDDCWALRRALPHLVLDSQNGLMCRHLAGAPPAYVCVPLFAQGDVLGCLHVNTPAGQLSDRRQQLVKTVADAIALSLANLRLRESLRQQSIIDMLTGLFNRRYMEETLEREVRRCARAQRPLSVVMMDLDHFKSFNDTHGHAAGDILLSELGSFLRSHVRVEDIACRYGGEEFTLILPDSDLEATAQRAEHLRRGIQSLQVEYGGRVIGPVTISLGVAAFPNHGADGALILHCADEALYQAKRAGRNQIVVAGLPSEPESRTGAHGHAGRVSP